MKLAFAILLVFSCPLLSNQTWDLDDWIIPFCEDDFSCGNGECIDLTFLCNGDLDCENGADEANCFGDLKNPKTGKQLDLLPEPIDSSNDLCSSCTYLCNVDSVRKWCSCPEHYELASDQRSCLPTASGYLVLSTGSRLFRFYPLWQSSDSFSEIPLPPNILITDLVVNMALNEIYLHDGVTNRLGLLDMKRADLDDQWNTLVDSDLGHVSGLGFDSTTRTLYWIDSDKGTLEVVDTRSRHRATLKRELDQPISITVVEKQAIYIGLGGSLPSIISVSFDGIITRRVIASKVGKPMALSTTILDPSRLFWADAKLHKIDVVRIGDQRFLSSTGDQEQKSWLLEGEHMHNISSMITFGEKIFWTVSHLGDIFSASLKNGQQYEHQSEFPIPTGSIDSQIRLVPVITRSISDESTTLECNTQCNHLCLYDSKHRNITCHCSDGYYSPDNGVTCIPEHVFSVKEDKTNKNTLSEVLLSSSSSKIMISKWVPWVAVGLSALFFIGVCLGLFWKIRKMHENSRWKAMLIQQHRQNTNNSDVSYSLCDMDPYDPFGFGKWNDQGKGSSQPKFIMGKNGPIPIEYDAYGRPIMPQYGPPQGGYGPPAYPVAPPTPPMAPSGGRYTPIEFDSLNNQMLAKLCNQVTALLELVQQKEFLEKQEALQVLDELQASVECVSQTKLVAEKQPSGPQVKTDPSVEKSPVIKTDPSVNCVVVKNQPSRQASKAKRKSKNKRSRKRSERVSKESIQRRGQRSQSKQTLQRGRSVNKMKNKKNKSLDKNLESELKKMGKGVSVQRIPSDAPTALIAPDDYEHIFSANKKNAVFVPAKPVKERALPEIPSDAPTALIAPDDYEHIYSVKKDPARKVAKAKGVPQIPSDAPTALIAPDDYVHIYAATKKEAPPPNRGQLPTIPSDAPTALIAPDDYEHIYSAPKKEPAAKAAGGGTALKQVPSDAPTALIAPDDYVHIFHKNESAETLTQSKEKQRNKK